MKNNLISAVLKSLSLDLPTQQQISSGHIAKLPSGQECFRVFDGQEWWTFGQSPSVSERPAASEVGLGVWVVGQRVFSCDGVNWRSSNRSTKTPSIYSADKTATTNGADQYEAIATGASILDVINKSLVNKVYIGLGSTGLEAKANRDSGIAGVNRFLIMPEDDAVLDVSEYKYCAWIGVTGSATIKMSQKV